MDEPELVQDCAADPGQRPDDVLREAQRGDRDAQATEERSCLAKAWMWLGGKGVYWLSLRKSKTDWDRSSETMQMWLRWSKQSSRWMHLLSIPESALSRG